ncbi:hypothetical protein NLG97_g6447 [Lecanicillium saksenae]|uniref:Uncharacterized protein n=1 Tax=Lecanicillium saksenae TaxID=468837 RepID=A0ACC1QQ65_9HYPO|nr:hypothetical protein NLG97_g6447 [Lecanicillium saksenae]
MDARPAKRPRSNTDPVADLADEEEGSSQTSTDSTTSSICTRYDFDVMLSEMSTDNIIELLSTLAREMPAVAAALRQAHDEEMTTPLPPIDFEHYSESAWSVLVRCEGLRSRQQDAESGDTIETVMSYIHTIADQALPANSAFETKKSGLETIQKITEYLVETGDITGRKIREELGYDTTIPDYMIQILESMTLEERTQVGTSADEKGTLISKVEWLVKEAKSYRLDGLESLEEVIELMSI